jgi:hypothetical protein
VARTMAWLFAHAEEDDIRYAALFDYRDYHAPEGCTEPDCWPVYSGLKRLEYLSPKYTPGGSELGEFKVDRPLRCVYKALISGASCHRWQAETLTGGTDEEPAIASPGVGRLETFGRGADGVLETRAWDPAGSWSEPSPLPGPAVASGPTAVSWGPGRVDVVARAADGTVEHWSRVEGVWSSENLGGATTEDPAISSWGPGRLDLFVRGSDGSLDHRAFEPATGWSDWERLPGPPILSSPAAVSPSGGVLEVLATVADGTVERWTYGEGPWTMESLGGPATSAPAIVSPAPNRLDAFVRGADGTLMRRSWDTASGWSPWAPVPGAAIASAPAAVAWNPNRIDVVATVAGSGIGHWYLEG